MSGVGCTGEAGWGKRGGVGGGERGGLGGRLRGGNRGSAAEGGQAGNHGERLRSRVVGVTQEGGGGWRVGSGRQDWAATLMLSQQTIQTTDVRNWDSSATLLHSSATNVKRDSTLTGTQQRRRGKCHADSAKVSISSSAQV